jgi:nicotinamidase-related amidase
MLDRSKTVLFLIDVQGKLARSAYECDKVFANIATLLQGMRVLDVPVLWFEQIPEKLGPTVDEVKKHVEGYAEPIPKSRFSCIIDGITERIGSPDDTAVVICGIETHVCVYQTTRDLCALGYHVEAAADCISSRTAQNREIGLARIQSEGAKLTSVEMVLFDLLGDAKDPCFKDILRLVK